MKKKTDKSNKRKRVLEYLKALMITAFGVIFIFTIVKSKWIQDEILCQKIEIEIKDQNKIKFITENEALKIITDNGKGNFINQKISSLDLPKLEEKLEQNDFIKNAEVYNNFDGTLKIDIVQKKPLYRIINNNNVSYYISKDAHRIPLSSNFTTRVIIATGYIPLVENVKEDKINASLKQLVEFIEADKFWKAMISQIEVRKNGDFSVIPKLKGHTVLLGSSEDLKSKFDKLKTFYKQALSNTEWTKYKEINLKFKGQLICSK